MAALLIAANLRVGGGIVKCNFALRMQRNPLSCLPWIIPRLRIEGRHEFSTLAVCHLLLHPIALPEYAFELPRQPGYVYNWSSLAPNRLRGVIRQSLHRRADPGARYMGPTRSGKIPRLVPERLRREGTAQLLPIDDCAAGDGQATPIAPDPSAEA